MVGVLLGAVVLATAGVVYLYLFQRDETTFWEYALPYAVSLFVASSAMLTIRYAVQKDAEFWGGYVVQAEYLEPYEEWEDHTKTVCEGEGDEEECHTEHYRTCDYHPALWSVSDSNSIEVGCDGALFDRLVDRFDNRTFSAISRDYCGKRGGRWITKWPGSDETLEPMFTEHAYKNPIIAGTNVLKFEEPTKEEVKQYGLFNYPKIGWLSGASVGYGGPSFLLSQAPLDSDGKQAQRDLWFYNAKYAGELQLIMWLLVFRDQPLEASFYQEGRWQGGNKNELVLTLGVDGAGNLRWARAFSWTESIELLRLVEEHAMEDRDRRVNLTRIVGAMEAESQKRWKRKHFSDFNYISFRPPLWAVILAYLLVIAGDVATVFIVSNNRYRPER